MFHRSCDCRSRAACFSLRGVANPHTTVGSGGAAQESTASMPVGKIHRATREEPMREVFEPSREASTRTGIWSEARWATAFSKSAFTRPLAFAKCAFPVNPTPAE